MSERKSNLKRRTDSLPDEAKARESESNLRRRPPRKRQVPVPIVRPPVIGEK